MPWQHSKREFEEIVNRYGQDVFRLAYARVGNREDAQDIYQNVFLKLYQKREVFENEEHMKAWLLKVTTNSSLDLLRSIWRNRIDSYEEYVENFGGFADAQTETNVNEKDVWTEVFRLPEKLRVVIHLYYYYGYSTEQIADITQTKPATVRSRLDRARKKLKERLGDSYV